MIYKSYQLNIKMLVLQNMEKAYTSLISRTEPKG